ncbi:hypothetical protein Tco_0662760, partial [Tanacetum coccineum]
SPLAAATAVVAPEIFFAAAELLVLPEHQDGVVEDKVKVVKGKKGGHFGSVQAIVIGHGDCGYDDLISRKLAR